MAETGTHRILGDETFMSADDLRSYMQEIEQSKLTKELSAMDRAEKAREELIKTLSQPVDLTPERLHQISENLRTKMRLAAQRGETEIMVMRFPNTLCSDKGRAINNAEDGWPDSLTGRPRQAYELWRDHLRAGHYKLKAMIIDWPNGMPGDVGFFLSWA
ncbi:hypothetical protein EZH22_05000 [Xanthobacter dioxanivorans]|uniref:Uncharacterized protein n=1 Tax=Xanthobacter dioxanivorans TaxID=2528964 RepID=A0A974PQS4_9HYPH|nr:hypothetical protein [Xanthobacter dioxanivorans]QRG07746.1 hypothetical protein EZH22_05000 [Xanthobacter dioxanivorans]